MKIVRASFLPKLFFCCVILGSHGVSQQEPSWTMQRMSIGSLFFEKGITNDHIRTVQADLEQASALYEREWNMRRDRPMTIYVYATSASFQKRTKQRRYTAAIWDGSAMHLQNPSLLEQRAQRTATILHEMAHALLHVRWQGKLPLWFEEGFAVYTSGEIGTLPHATEAIPNLRTFQKRRAACKNSREVQRWYASAALLVAIIIRQYGNERLKAALTSGESGSFEKNIASAFRVQYTLFETSILDEYRSRVANKKYLY